MNISRGRNSRAFGKDFLREAPKMDRELECWLNLHNFYLYSGSYETKNLADYLAVTPRTIERWIKGKTKPKKEQLARIKRYLEAKRTS
ncbi:MAG: hypothetical protein A3G37_04110 [Omnitrophica WOR_2 bacterium RIFCSPLOWO2_12_FULL_46_30]|nr:MAG: hypothetical protein A3D27_02405 [Omnitrophica WOR_2 bacterium RIFCSPHIGHO2_02_FULL_46_37]OGX42899.1 MAG: hypothetical protein A3H41_01205 [Omnitrophica WOR_2 bacterium RIFCSPLOWO2_02_FULL_45_28]OGX51685.1 MAG: hypothetical protein A3G37_04110 [Omnitrophica WOR_2 bacterium RIFCSPLOWO2_12_FULL_46_30]